MLLLFSDWRSPAIAVYRRPSWCWTRVTQVCFPTLSSLMRYRVETAILYTCSMWRLDRNYRRILLQMWYDTLWIMICWRHVRLGQDEPMYHGFDSWQTVIQPFWLSVIDSINARNSAIWRKTITCWCWQVHFLEFFLSKIITWNIIIMRCCFTILRDEIPWHVEMCEVQEQIWRFVC